MTLIPSGATVRRQIEIAADRAAVWDAIADFGAVHTRVAPGFLTALELDGSDRIVTFGNPLRTSEGVANGRLRMLTIELCDLK